MPPDVLFDRAEVQVTEGAQSICSELGFPSCGPGCDRGIALNRRVA